MLSCVLDLRRTVAGTGPRTAANNQHPERSGGQGLCSLVGHERERVGHERQRAGDPGVSAW